MEIIIHVFSAKINYDYKELALIDPYVTIKLIPNNNVQKTRTVDNTLVPSWNEVLKFQNIQIENDGLLKIKMFSRCIFEGKDIKLGSCVININNLIMNIENDNWYILKSKLFKNCIIHLSIKIDQYKEMEDQQKNVGFEIIKQSDFCINDGEIFNDFVEL